jgi:ribonuclease E
VRTNSFRAARVTSSLARAPGSLTEEIARMLETEPQDLQPNPDQASTAGSTAGQEPNTEGGHRRGLLRRGRRSVLKPAALPAFRSPAVPEGAPAADAASAPAGAVPGMPAGSGGTGRAGSQASAQPQFAAPAFQPPVVIFQPPDLTERPSAETGRGRGGTGATGPDGGPADGADADGSADAAEAAASSPSRRRRRGGRGRGKGGSADAGSAEAGHEEDAGGQAGAAGSGTGDQPAGRAGAAVGRQDTGTSQSADADRAGSGQPGDSGDEGGQAAASGTSSRRRRRRRQRDGAADGTANGADTQADDDPSEVVVHVRAPRPAAAAAEADDVRAVKGSTRLEAKRQRRREGRDSGRRRPPVISESEFLARREAVERVMVVRQQGDRTQIAVLEDGVLVEHYVDKASHQSYVGNVYLGKVQNVLPSMEAAFVDIGKGRNAVLYAGEVNFDASGLEGVAKRIESALKSGQSIMVQVTKDPIGHKGARLTSQVSLPGRYLVYVPGASMTGISRKLPDTERTRLKQILKQVAPEEGGIIVRTAAEGASEEELSHDVTRLFAQWQAIERKAKTATAPALLYSEPDLTIRVVRDIFNEDFTKLVIASDSEWDLVDEYVRYVAPTLADRLERWTDDKDLFSAYRIDEQLTKALDRKVWLPSGGSLVIDTTEAMTVIDVNTGKFTGQGGNLEQTVTRNNLEAAEEIVRQLRLRDIGGIIVIDFIDMVLESNRDLVLRRLIECLARDRTKHQVAEVTSLGLVQMTRKRVGTGLLAAFSVPCEQCNGRGVLVSVDLTDLPQPPGRGSDRAGAAVGGTPKPGPVRTRSSRSKAATSADVKTAIDATAAGDEARAEPARVEPARAGSGQQRSAETAKTAVAPVAEGPAAEGPVVEGPAADGLAAAVPAAAIAADGGPDTGSEPTGQASAGSAGSGSSRSGSRAGSRSGSARSGAAARSRQAGARSPASSRSGQAAEADSAGPGSDGWTAPRATLLSQPDSVAGANGADGQAVVGQDTTAAQSPAEPRRRPRRAAHREAGPPDSVATAERPDSAERAESAEPVEVSPGGPAGQPS